jgi:hypothetical protein
VPLLLPATKLGLSSKATADGRAAWNEQGDPTGIVAQSAQSVLTNLVALELLEAPGVSLPLAPAKAFEWRLAAGDHTTTHQDAVNELRLLLLAQFLGLVKLSTYSLNQTRLLAKVLKAGTQNPELTLWLPKSPSDNVGRVLAGSLPPQYPLFPSASVQTAPGRTALAAWLLQGSKGQLVTSGDQAQFSDAAQAERFRRRLEDLVEQKSVIDSAGPWCQPLQRLAEA